MPQCNYAILGHCESDLASDCVPCLLLLKINGDNNLKVLALPPLKRLLNEVSIRGREWICEVLSEICERQASRGVIEEIRFEQFYALDVGPLRTCAYGAFEANDAEDLPNLIWVQVKKQLCPTEDEDCSTSSFQELTPGKVQEYL